MSPTTFYNHLSDRNWTWWGLKRLRPAPDRNYPWIALVVFPVLTAVLVFLPVLALSRAVDLHPAFLVMVGVWGFTVSLVHRLFAALSWNQRAARLRRSGESVEPARPGILIRWLAGPAYVLLIAGLTPLVVLSAVENFRGAWHWRTVRTQLMAAGERLDIATIARTTPTSEEDNFFAVAPFGQLLLPEGSASKIDTNAMAQFRRLDLPERGRPKRESGDRRPFTVEEWAAAFEMAISNQVHTAKSPPLFPYLAATNGASPATVILTALSGADPLIDSLCEASRRPEAVFPVRWSDGFNALLPHLAALKGAQTLLEVRVAALIAQGKADRAFAETECAVRLANVLRTEPLLISQLVRFAQLNLAAQTVWRGLSARVWNDAQLAALQTQFATNDVRDSIVLAFEGERAMALASFDRWTRNGLLFWASTAPFEVSDGGEESGGGYSLMPWGWIRQNQVSLAGFYQDLLDRARRLKQADRDPKTFRSLEYEGALFSAPISPYNMFARMLAPAVSKGLVKAIRTQVMLQCVSTGCALERYRLKHQRYPESLTDLVPEFLAEVPLDPASQEPLRYRQTRDGLFRLWSVGPNGKDDGGVIQRKGTPELDWPWPYQVE